MENRQLAFLRPDQILQEMKLCPVVYLPLGPLEWHGPHLPLGVDPLNAERVAQRAAEETGGLILPTFFWGTERERTPEMLKWLGFEGEEWIVGMDFTANSLPSLYASEEMFALAVREQLRLAANMGFRLAVAVTGHAAENQIAVLKRLEAELNAAGRMRVLVVLPFVTDPSGVMPVGHATRTSVMRYLHPETVDTDKLPPLPEPLRNQDWAIVDYHTFLGRPSPDHTVAADDDPRKATAEMGRQTVEQATAQIVEQVNTILKDLRN
jgi:creatinine amidohydrolase